MNTALVVPEDKKEQALDQLMLAIIGLYEPVHTDDLGIAYDAVIELLKRWDARRQRHER